MKKESTTKKIEDAGVVEIRIHGSGGQGAVTTAQLLAMAAFYDGKYAQAFPFFGVERRGSPTVSFVRISDKPINLREQIYAPDYAIIFDYDLIEISQADSGVKKQMIINTNKKIAGCYTQDVSQTAMEIFGKPIINTLILGAFIGFTKLVSLDSLLKAVEQKFKGKDKIIEQNKQAIEKSYKEAENNANKN